VDIVLDSGVTVRYHDPRRFGAMLWVPGRARRIRCSPGSGPSPSTLRSTPATCGRRRAGASRDQARADGQSPRRRRGNIYANEALFRAGIRPTTPAHRLSRARLERLVQTVRETLTDAIAKGGSTLRDYVDSDGEPATSSSTTSSMAARRALRVCGAPIRMRRLGGRATSWCPRCQR